MGRQRVRSVQPSWQHRSSLGDRRIKDRHYRGHPVHDSCAENMQLGGPPAGGTGQPQAGAVAPETAEAISISRTAAAGAGGAYQLLASVRSARCREKYFLGRMAQRYPLLVARLNPSPFRRQKTEESSGFWWTSRGGHCALATALRSWRRLGHRYFMNLSSSSAWPHTGSSASTPPAAPVPVSVVDTE